MRGIITNRSSYDTKSYYAVLPNVNVFNDTYRFSNKYSMCSIYYFNNIYFIQRFLTNYLLISRDAFFVFDGNLNMI